MRWTMVIDLRMCVGCGACSAACSQTNNVQLNMWRRVFDCGMNGQPEGQRMLLPMSCMHCNKAPCKEVCPTAATYSRPDKTIDIKYDLCIGCGYCIVACPYHARTIVFNENDNYDAEITSRESERFNSNSNNIGVSKKCNFCLSRVDKGLKDGLKPGIDSEASPMCVNTCSSEALYFGDLDDPNSKVSCLIRENKTVRLQEELGTDPSMYYIINDIEPEDLEIESRQLIKPKKLEVWKWPAVVNFTMGGMAAGFYIISLFITTFNSDLYTVSQYNKLKLLAPLMMVMGLLILTLEAGRPLRVFYLLNNLGNSWMSREVLFGAVFIMASISECFWPNTILIIIASVAALGFVISQGLIIYSARAVIAWNVPLIPLLFIASGFTLGEGMVLLITAIGRMDIGSNIILTGLVFLVVNLVLLVIYLYSTDSLTFREVTEKMRRSNYLVLTIGIGHLLPITLLFLLLLIDDLRGVSGRNILIVAGVSIIFAGVLQKIGVILWANYLRGIFIGQPRYVYP